MPSATPAWAQSSDPSLIAEFGDGRLQCTLNRPERRNALSPEMLFALARIVNNAGERDDVRSVSLRGAGGLAFSAGFDIKILAERGADAHAGDPMETASLAIRRCPAPTFAAIDGFCLGAGLDLALSCDFRIASAPSTFAIPAVRLGTVYPPRAIGRILQDIGPGACKELFVLGRKLNSTRALALGLVHAVVAVEDLDDELAQWSDLPASGTFAVRAHKRIVDALLHEERSEELYNELAGLRSEALNRPERALAIETFSGGRDART